MKAYTGKVSRKVTVHGKDGDYEAIRWFIVVYDNEFDNETINNLGKISQVSKTIFGKAIPKEALARLAGAYENETINIKTIGLDKLQISINGNHYDSKVEISKIKISGKLKTNVHIISTTGKPKKSTSAKNTGTAVNKIQTILENGKKIGLDLIHGEFIRTDTYDGYFKYARLGFDGNIDPKLAGEINATLSNSLKRKMI